MVGNRSVDVQICFAAAGVCIDDVQVIARLRLNRAVIAGQGARCIDEEMLLLSKRVKGTEQKELSDGIGRLRGRNDLARQFPQESGQGGFSLRTLRGDVSEMHAIDDVSPRDRLVGDRYRSCGFEEFLQARQIESDDAVGVLSGQLLPRRGVKGGERGEVVLDVHVPESHVRRVVKSREAFRTADIDGSAQCAVCVGVAGGCNTASDSVARRFEPRPSLHTP